MFADSGGDDEFTLAESDVNAGKWGPPNPRETEKVASMHEMLKADIDKIPDMPYELVNPPPPCSRPPVDLFPSDAMSSTRASLIAVDIPRAVAGNAPPEL